MTSITEQYSGLVEVYHNGAWGTVCASTWTYENALLACRTAGFNSAVRGLSQGNLFYGGGTGNVLLDNVRCTGNEASFFDCPANQWGVVGSGCSGHQNDAAAVCSDGELTGKERNNAMVLREKRKKYIMQGIVFAVTTRLYTRINPFHTDLNSRDDFW